VNMTRFGIPAVTAILLTVAGCSIPDDIDQRGNFQIEYYTTSALGHTGTRKALYHVNGSRRTKVTDGAVSFTIAPRDPDRIIYDTCDLDSCTHNFFDGHARRGHLIGRGLKVSMSALEDSSRWSGSGNHVVIGEDYEMVLLNLQSGEATRLTETLQLSEPFYPEKWQLRQARWGGWAPNGAYGAVIVMAPHGPGGPPVYEWDEELYALDAATKTLMLVTTHRGELGGTGQRRLWRAGDFRWDGAILQPPR
jgi:hypothetical protein